MSSKSVKPKVEKLLQSQQMYRDSDKYLLLGFWADQGLLLTNEQQQIFIQNCSPAESITRARRELKAEYPASKAVDNRRFGLFKKEREDHAPVQRRMF